MNKLKTFKTITEQPLKARTGLNKTQYMFIERVLIEVDKYIALGGYYYIEEDQEVVFETFAKEFSWDVANSIPNVTGDTFTDKYLYIINTVAKAVLESENNWGSGSEVWEEV